MIVLIRSSLFILVILLQGGSLADSPSVESETRLRVLNGLANNDERAFEEASKLSINQAAPLLLVYVNDASTNKERAQRAREILRTMPGFSAYMKQRILEKRKKAAGEVEMREFDMLQAIGGDESAAAAAPFLFVDDVPMFLGDDFSAGSINYNALNALLEMHLADGPLNKEYPDFTKPNMDEWKKWAVKKGYKDNSMPALITLEQKGVPPELVAKSMKIAAAAKSFPTATPIPSPSGVQPQAMASASTPRPSAIATPTAAAERPSSNILVVPLGILAAVIAGAAVFFLRTKR